MSKEIEADGYITRETDISPTKHTCYNCKRYKYDESMRALFCAKGHKLRGTDWRMKYEVCDDWKGEE